MITENLSTLKIHKLSQEQYDRELEAGRIDKNALYLTPEDIRIDEGADEVYVQSEEPVDAPDGSIWVDIDEISGGTLLSGSVPSVTVDDNDKMLQVVNGEYALVTIENSSIKTYIDNYINEALGGDY